MNIIALKKNKEVNPELIDKLLAFELSIGSKFNVTASFETKGHSPTGYHPKGMAADGFFSGSKGLDILKVKKEALARFNGVGFYPNKGNWFLHLDIRPKEAKASWIRTDKGQYVVNNMENWNKHMGFLEKPNKINVA